MDFSLKEAIGLGVAVIAVILIILSLFHIDFFNGVKDFITSSSQNTTVNVNSP